MSASVVRMNSPRETCRPAASACFLGALPSGRESIRRTWMRSPPTSRRMSPVLSSERSSTTTICSRTLEEFEQPFAIPLHLLVRKSKPHAEIEWGDDDSDTFEVSVPEEQRELDISEIVRQCIELERPISPVKPGAPLPEGVLPDDIPVERPTDPRWDALRGLKEN